MSSVFQELVYNQNSRTRTSEGANGIPMHTEISRRLIRMTDMTPEQVFERKLFEAKCEVAAALRSEIQRAREYVCYELRLKINPYFP